MGIKIQQHFLINYSNNFQEILPFFIVTIVTISHMRRCAIIVRNLALVPPLTRLFVRVTIDRKKTILPLENTSACDDGTWFAFHSEIKLQ